MLVKKRILIISNYPIKQPLHGGQKRVAAIVEEYKKVFSNVKFVAIFVKDHYPVHGSEDLYLTGEWASKVRGDHLTSDIQIANAMKNSPRLRKKIEKLLISFNPDIIQFEQAFPFLGFREILKDLNLHPRIVYNSQNIEAPMRREIMKLGKAKQKDINSAYETIDEVELYLAKNADVVSVVSKEDGEYYKSRGGKDYIIAANGISPVTFNQKSHDKWAKYFEALGVKKIALFVGSGHLPNMAGIKKMIGFRVGFIPTDTRIVFAGGAGSNIRENFDKSDMLAVPFWRRVINVGILRQESLEGLIARADVMLLPIVDGGGSNLKTAEAILSGKKIVATTFAFRGFEQYMKLPNIWIANTEKDFKSSITEALAAPTITRTDEQDELANHVQWKYSLKTLIDEVAQL